MAASTTSSQQKDRGRLRVFAVWEGLYNFDAGPKTPGMSGHSGRRLDPDDVHDLGQIVDRTKRAIFAAGLTKSLVWAI
jgi:hypothetical protein